MTTFLDLKTSQNASYANSIAIPILVINTPQLIAQQTLNLSGGTANLTRVEFSGVVAVQLPLLPLATTVLVSVVRGLTAEGVIVFSAAQNLELSLLGPQLIAFSGSDFNAPNAAGTAYSVFIQTSAIGTIRVGPESFNFIGVSDV
ncbi:hypothetical protein GCM10008018_26540 [Paenibacillus marchantiophytorum]|uniref:Exosporium leader peptide n=1 Tax=Paenibacillus marchantiophytorum TaxID=1619310 RepID=A0ABQ1EP56_9BACL|nr:hypothetical protein [Paenibacillus marchantiophytorum]GFZ79684.1 hypothetical protein GCM10008018_26540 [Paenibacillus marchantiophytorum]